MRDTKAFPRKAPKEHGAVRFDGFGWENALTGFGVLGRDKRLGANFNAPIVTQERAEEIWKGDDIAARIIDTIPNEMLREGYDLRVPDDQERGEAICDRAEELQVNEMLRESLSYERAYGGGAILLGVDDGQDWKFPLNEKRIKSFDWLSTLTPRELMPSKYYSNPLGPKYGEIAVYRLVPIDSPPGADIRGLQEIHESRLIRFGGIRTSRGMILRNAIPGWGISTLVRCLQVVNDFQASWQGAAILMQDFAPAVLKLDGLAKLLASQKPKENDLTQRARAISLGRSIANTTIIDLKEEYKRETVSVGGLAELLQQQMLRLAATAEMPVSLLMGQAPAGLNATGDSDIRWFYDQISSRQEKTLKRPLKQLLRLIMLTTGGAPKKWSIKFRAPWQLTEAEAATVRFTQAQTDQIYIQNQVVTPQEIAKSRFSDEYSTETTIDLDLREEMDDPEDEKVRLGAGAAEDKEQEQANAEAVAKKPAAPAAAGKAAASPGKSAPSNGGGT